MRLRSEPTSRIKNQTKQKKICSEMKCISAVNSSRIFFREGGGGGVIKYL